jgi:hypothetical protein
MFKKGDSVILGPHDFDPTNTFREFWVDGMDKYIGKTAILICLGGSDKTGLYWEVDIDRGVHYWREANMKPAIFNANQVCDVCKKSSPHKEPNQKDNTYICPSCIFLTTLGK